MPLIVLAVVLALCCSASWGVSDFIGGSLGRRMAVLEVLVATQVTGLIAGLVFAAVLGGVPPLEPQMLVAFAAGACSVLGVGALYRGLSAGTMGVVAPIAALNALLPVSLGLATGDSPGTVRLAGMLIAIVGVVVTSLDVRAGHGEAPRSNRQAIAFAILAALAFGGVQIAIDAGAEVDVYWTIGLMRIAAVTTLLLFAATIGAGIPRLSAYRGRPIPLLLLGGLLDVSAATFYAASTTHGDLSVVAVLSALYPVVTVFLAGILLGERLDRLQTLGAIATLGGVVMLSVGG